MKYYLVMWESQASADARADDHDESMYEGSMPMGELMLDLSEATIKRAQEVAYKEEIVDMHHPECGAVPTGKWRKSHGGLMIPTAGGTLQYVWRNDITGADELCLTIREASVI